MIEIRKGPGQKLLELGGGENRHPAADCMVDVRPLDTVDFVVDLAEPPWPISADEWDCVYSAYVLEHVPFTKAKAFLEECFRILKPGGRLILLLPDAEAQFEWAKKNPDGWDGKDFFTAASDLVFGAQTYASNFHAAFMTPDTIRGLLRAAGFVDVLTQPFNPRQTDMMVEAKKPSSPEPGMLQVAGGQKVQDMREDARKTVQELEAQKLVTVDAEGRVWAHPATPAPAPVGFDYGTTTPDVAKPADDAAPDVLPPATAPGSFRPALEETQFRSKEREIPPEQLFDREYFDGGGKVGGYARDRFGAAYQDFPVHEITFKHVMARRPESVLELGCARGYIVKRLQDAGVRASGLEVSRHCYLTRAATRIHQGDLCQPPWKVELLTTDPSYDLCFSIAVLEHVPETVLPDVIKEMARTCKRGLHGIDFGGKDDGFDKTHICLRPKIWWVEQFARHAPGWPVEIVDKEELEKGEFPPEVLAGDGKVKLNLGSFCTMHHHGWENIDLYTELEHYAAANGYKYRVHDLRTGLPYPTGGVDLIMMNHVFEHFSYEDGVKLLKECRRVLKPETGALRLAVPDAKMLVCGYAHAVLDDSCDLNDLPHADLSSFHEMSTGAASRPTAAGKLWELLIASHLAIYDWETLKISLEEAGFVPHLAQFRGTSVPGPRHEGSLQILRETIDQFPDLSLFVDAIPKVA
jgi:predicted SAM-dependent methyltransferase